MWCDKDRFAWVGDEWDFQAEPGESTGLDIGTAPQIDLQIVSNVNDAISQIAASMRVAMPVIGTTNNIITFTD